MKKVIVMLLCMIGLSAVAQKGERQERRSEIKMTPEQRATIKSKKMTLALDLTEAQQKQIQVLHLKIAETRRAKADERRAHKDNHEHKKLTSDERYAMTNERLDQKIAFKSEMKDILSKKQFVKWEEITHRNIIDRKAKRKKHKRHTK